MLKCTLKGRRGCGTFIYRSSIITSLCFCLATRYQKCQLTNKTAIFTPPHPELFSSLEGFVAIDRLPECISVLPHFLHWTKAIPIMWCVKVFSSIIRSHFEHKLYWRSVIVGTEQWIHNVTKSHLWSSPCVVTNMYFPAHSKFLEDW